MADAEKKIRELVEKIARENDYTQHEIEIKAIHSGGSNLTSNLFLITISFPDKKNEELFAKIALTNDNIREVVNAKRLYYCEIYFYKKLAKIYEELMVKHQVPVEHRFVHAKYFGCNTNLYEETLVLENLVARGYESYSRFVTLTWDHMVAAVEVVAKIHALSFAFQKANPEEFDKVCNDLVLQMGIKDDDPKMKKYRANVIEQGVGLLREDQKDPVKKCMKQLGENAFTNFWKHRGTRVIVHGDYRACNLLFKRLSTKMHAIPVDYQAIKCSSPITDLVYFEILGTDGNFRAKYHQRYLDLYHKELTAALQRLNIDVNEVYPRKTFDREVKELYPYSVPLGMSLIPLVLAENPPETRGGGLDAFFVPGSEEFKKRYTELVDDCIRWGLI